MSLSHIDNGIHRHQSCVSIPHPLSSPPLTHQYCVSLPPRPPPYTPVLCLSPIPSPPPLHTCVMSLSPIPSRPPPPYTPVMCLSPPSPLVPPPYTPVLCLSPPSPLVPPLTHQYCVSLPPRPPPPTHLCCVSPPSPLPPPYTPVLCLCSSRHRSLMRLTDLRRLTASLIHRFYKGHTKVTPESYRNSSCSQLTTND